MTKPKLITIPVLLAASLAACIDSSESVVGGPGIQPGKPLPEVVHEQASAYAGEPSVAVTLPELPELPELTLVYEQGRVLVLGDDGSELCRIPNPGDGELDAAAVSTACSFVHR